MFNIINPIPESLKDSLEVTELFRKYNMVPHYGCGETTSHTMLQLIDDTTSLSPSHKACQNDISTYAFGNALDIVPRRVPGLVREKGEENLLSPQEKKRFSEQVLEKWGISLLSILSATKELFTHLTDSGNAYMMIRIVFVNGQPSVKFIPIHYKQAAYLATRSGIIKKIVWTEKWDEVWWAKKRPTVKKCIRL